MSDKLRPGQSTTQAAHGHSWSHPQPCEIHIRLRLQELGLPYDLTTEDIVTPEPSEMLVLVLYLFQTLPQFLPRTTVEFKCRLGETQVCDRLPFGVMQRCGRTMHKRHEKTPAYPHLSIQYMSIAACSTYSLCTL